MNFQNTYSKDWPAIAQATKDAANWRCIRCDHPHDKESGHVLTVHHFDGDKSNNAWWNLMALCQACHLSVQARVDPHIPYFLEHSQWAKPYVAGFYAHHYLNQHITRAQAEESLPLLLSLGQCPKPSRPSALSAPLR